jgi:adenosylcobinamide kinase/adenosylcobinamide-phosphate guanylyltransferase
MTRKMGAMILILGGARSGKSSLAEEVARRLGEDAVLYVATAEAKDEEMEERIQRHRLQRPRAWRTLEQPFGVAAAVNESLAGARIVLLDCMTLLVSNIILRAGEEDIGAEKMVMAEIEAMISAAQTTPATWIVVSNEVGMGLVPSYPLGRIYRDALGRANQRLAQAADHVWFLIAGLPMTLKGQSPQQLTLIENRTSPQNYGVHGEI